MAMFPGTIGWVDLTVDDAPRLRDFYREVAGWVPAPVPMGDYEDFTMSPRGSEQPVAGVCHRRGGNADLPPAWIVYIAVEDLDRSLAACREGGGEMVAGPKEMGESGRYAIIRDPAGAVCGLWQDAAVE